MKVCNLMLHCGGEAVERSQVGHVRTPEPTATWTPVPHIAFIGEIERALAASSLEIVNQAHALSHGGLRYFGLIQLRNHTRDGEVCLVLGLRNSHDKRFPAGLVVGSQVFVCDNLSFNGEITVVRRHTRFIYRDLPSMALRAMGGLCEAWNHHALRIEHYRACHLGDHEAHDLMIRAVDVGVCPVSVLPRVIEQWRHPSHDAFVERNIWSLFNGFTEALKGNLAVLPRRTRALHALLDGHVGIVGQH